jgi:O-antigen/teichoic acid export membrane protein
VPLAGGFTLVAGSGAALLAAAPRVMGHDSFSGLSMAWVISVIFGFGVATPTEQLISRRRNAGDQVPGRSPAYWLSVVGLAVCAAVGVLLTRDVGQHYPMLAWSLVAVLGWVFVSPQRGELLGHQAIRAYAATMVLEGLLRTGLVLVAIVWTSAASVLFGASIGVPLLVSAAAAHLIPISRDGRHESPRIAPGFEQVAFIVTALGYQASINLAPLALSWKVADQNRDFVGAFVVANSWMRLPTILVGSITVAALAELSRVASIGSLAGFRTELRRSGAACLTLAVGGALVCGATAEAATTLVYGSRIVLPAHGFAFLGLSTALAIVASWLSVPLMAMRRAVTAAAVWGLGSALTVLTLAILPADKMLTIGLVLPLLATTLILFVASIHRIRTWSRTVDEPVHDPRG